MRLNWGHKILVVYLFFVVGILILAFKSSQQKFDLVQKDYYGAELKYQEVINATEQASALGTDLKIEKQGKILHVTLPESLHQSETVGEAQLYCIADENGDLKKHIITNNGVFDLNLLVSMKGNYTLKLSVQQNGIAYYFEKKIIL